MRLIDADKLYPDKMAVGGSITISQGQLAHAKTIPAIPIPENATNGDMIKTTYPDVKIIEIRGSFGKGELLGYRTWLGGHHQDYYLDWWNAPYKRGQDNEDNK